MSERKQEIIAKATGWSFATQLLAKLVVPVSNLILARILVPEDFGLIATINLVISFADTFALSGFHKYLVQHEFESNEERDRSANVALWTNVFIAIILYGIILVFSDTIADLVGSSGHGLEICIASISIPIVAVSSVFDVLCQRDFNFKALFFRRIVVCIIPFLITIPLALLGARHWALIIGTICSNLAALCFLLVSSSWKPALYYNFDLLREMLSFGLWMIAEAILLWATSNIDILIVSNVFGDYYTGLYKNSQATITGILSIVTAATTPVLFTALSREQNNKKEFEKTFYSYQKSVTMFVLPMGVGIFCFKDFITFVLLGQKWAEASDFIAIWGLCTAIVASFGTFIRIAYRALGRPKLSVVAQLIHVVLVIPMVYCGVRLGYTSLIYIRSIAYLTIVIIHMIIMGSVLKMNPVKMFLSVKEIVLCSILMGGVGVFLRTISENYILQAVWIIICIIAYFSMLCLFPEYRKSFLEQVQNLSKKFRGLIRR